MKPILHAMLAQKAHAALTLTLLGAFVAIGLFALCTYEARYTDASGARCATFQVMHHEFDLCHGRDDRDAPMPPAWPADWQPSSKVQP